MIAPLILFFQFLTTVPFSIGQRDPAPDFSAVTLDGQRFTNDALKGRTVLIEFWTTWCRFCRRDEPLLDSLLATKDRTRLTILAVNVNESRNTVRAYLARFPRISKVILTEETNLVATYSPRSLPLYVLIDHAGNIVAIRRGAMDERAFQSLVSAINDDLQQADPACCTK
ncbi:MAG TPA: TlpA disulfide reductase family protein [Bryobacteraceae bacterium]